MKRGAREMLSNVRLHCREGQFTGPKAGAEPRRREVVFTPISVGGLMVCRVGGENE